MLLIPGAAFPQRWSAPLSCWTSSGVNSWQRPTRRNTFLPSISPFPSPVDSVLPRSQSAWVSKSLVKTSRLGSVVSYVAIRSDEEYRDGYSSNHENLTVRLPFKEAGIDKV